LTPATGARTTRLCRPRLPSPKRSDRLMCCRPKFWRRRLSAGRLRAGWSLTENPPCNPSRARRCRVHRIPRPTSVTIAIRPSCGRGMAEVVGLIWGHGEAEYFCRKHWTKPCVICRASNAIGSSSLLRTPPGFAGISRAREALLELPRPALARRGRRKAPAEGLSPCAPLL
jgi:hypothetical protein